MSSDDERRKADERVEAALASRGLADPRPWLRDRLRLLRERDAAAFQAALAHFEEKLIPAVAAGEDPVAAWIAYGTALGEWTGAGRLLAVDASGRAAVWAPPHRDDLLVLHLPDAVDAPALTVLMPASLTPPQRAAVDLLVLGREGLGG